MTLPELFLIAALLVALGLIVTGVALISPAAAFIVAGLGLAALAVLTLTEVGD